MDKSIGKLTVYFDDPFWVGVFERIEDEKLSVCKITFCSYVDGLEKKIDSMTEELTNMQNQIKEMQEAAHKEVSKVREDKAR